MTMFTWKRAAAGLMALVMMFSLLPMQVLATGAAEPCTEHTLVKTEAAEATCLASGNREYWTCSVCEKVFADEAGTRVTTVELQTLPQLEHIMEDVEAKNPTYTSPGWNAHIACTRGHDLTNMDGYQCSYTEGKEIIPALGEPSITTYEEFLTNLELLEMLAQEYVKTHPNKDPIALVIKYIRTGVDRYNSGSWNIMAGYEDPDFANYVRRTEASLNAELEVDQYLKVTGLKDIHNFTLPNGDKVDFGHMFGTMDISYHNKGSVDHADVAGWAGDLVDLMSASDRAHDRGQLSDTDLETMTKEIRNSIFLKDSNEDDKFGLTDYYGDIDGYYVVEALYKSDYEAGTMKQIIETYCTKDLDDVDRAEFFLKTRLGNPGTRSQVRNAVYSEFTSNKTISTLESTREWLDNDASYLNQLRHAVCYAFADYICELAGDYVDVKENPFYTDFSSELSNLAPGITQEIRKATTADNKQIVYYLATADLSNPYVSVYANYNENDPGEGWQMARVLDQANAAQEKRSDPTNEHYVKNYQVITAINADGFNMSTGEPGGLLIMDGKEWHPANTSGFFGIDKNGKAVIGTTAEYNAKYKGQLQEAVAAFGTMLVKDGKLAISASGNYYDSRASRTAVGITKTGKVVFMVLDGRQEPVSCGGSMEEIAQIMLEAGCVQAVNLDGGGSTTYVSKPEGSDKLQVTSKPSDGYARSVSSTLLMVSTAPSSTAFDHARLDADYSYATVGTPVQITPVGVSATGNVADLPEGYTWAVADTNWGSITQDGIFTGKRVGDVEVRLMLGEEILGTTVMHIGTPDTVYFTRSNMDAVYGASIALPVAAQFEGKPIAISAKDVTITVTPAAAGTCSGFTFTAGAETSGIKAATITAALAGDESVSGSMTVHLYRQGENTFDFDQATGGDRQLAWLREVSNSVTEDSITYTAVDHKKDMVTSYVFAMDMSQIPIPAKLEDLTYMLPGADAVDASAWNFLLQLAERVSVLTTVTPVLKFDERFEVDYSKLSIKNEYFTLSGTTFDEDTNSLTLHLNWVDQTKAIDPATANPLCLVSGIKLTPKDDTFASSKKIQVVTSGEINYKIYLRANALYSFAQKPENQAVYSLTPFVNPDVIIGGAAQSGAYFADTYKSISDQYTLSIALKQGWVFEDGGYAYYVDGERMTGVHAVDGLYYDFGTSGINYGQTKYTGVFEDEAGTHVAKLGVIETSGWHTHGDFSYHCHNDGTAHIATVDNPITCIRGGYLTYKCNTCNYSQRVGDKVMPTGHTWNADHYCMICGHKGLDINDGTAMFGSIDNPRFATSIPNYAYASGGIRPSSFITFDKKNANNTYDSCLTWSNDANLNADNTMRDLYISWENNKGIGKCVIQYTGKGNYYGFRTLEYKIVPNNAANLTVTSKSSDSVTLSWTAGLGADYYNVYLVKGNNNTLIAKEVKGTTYTITGLKAGETYRYCVRAAAYSTHPDELGAEVKSSAMSNIVTVDNTLAFTITNSTKNSAEIVLSNATGKSVTKAVAVTAYDKNGKMLDTSYETVTLDNNGKTTLTLSCAASKEIATVKCFLLDGTSFAPTEIIWQQTMS